MRTRARTVLALLVAATLAPAGARAQAPATSLAIPVPVDDAVILHVLDRAGFGPRPGDVERVRAVGLGAWLARQLAPAGLEDRAAERALAALPTLNRSIPELLRDYPRPDPAVRQMVARGMMTAREATARYPVERRPPRITAELAAAKAVRAVLSERQLQEVMVDFRFNHFNVYAAKADDRWYVGAYERDAIRPHALGRFRDLLDATAHHPAMLFYLDNWLSVRPGFTPRAGPAAGRRLGLNEYLRGPFGAALRQIAALIRADVGLEVAFADVGGWDTPVAQRNERGQLAFRLRAFALALAAFTRDLGDRLSDVVLLTMSEFGRTVAENGNRGTDHGHATAMLVLGGGVRGGRVYGRWPGLAAERLHEGRDLAVTTDFRALFTEIATHQLAVPPGAALFPGFTPGGASLGLFT